MRYLNYAGYAAIPLAFLIHYIGAAHQWANEPSVTFLLAGIGIIPLAALMGEATAHLSDRAGPTWGGLLNATFGNAAELIIGIIGLTRGLNSVVKASLTGSILGNLLLVGGGAMVVGGWKREKQTFNSAAAESNAGMLTLAVASMMIPAIFHFTDERLNDVHASQHEHSVSLGTSVILLIIYVLGLMFTLRTHKHILSPAPSITPEDAPGLHALHRGWSVRKSAMVLLGASVGVAFIAELLVGSVEHVATSLQMNPIFIGVILLAIIGNAAEHSTALLLAHRNDMDTAMTITHQSSLQIALFVTPVLILASAIFVAVGWQHGPQLDLVFTPLEVAAVVLAVATVVVLGYDGETNWFEGALLLGLYVILGIAFFYIPTAAEAH